MEKHGLKKRLWHPIKSVFADPKQYISFFIAFLIIQTIFWTLLITTGTNNRTSDETLKEEFKYHFTVSGLTEHAYANLPNVEVIAKTDRRLDWPEIEYLGFVTDGFGTRSYKIGVILNDSDPSKSHNDFWKTVKEKNLEISKSSAEYTPYYTNNPAIRTQNKETYRTVSIAFAVVTVLLFIIVNKLKAPKTEDEKGDRVYVSTTSSNMFFLIKRIIFALMLLSAAVSFIFLILLLSIGNGTAFFFLYIALFLVCTLFLTELFNTRVNHYKFRYGIYMVFGADFKKLYSSAVREMTVVSLLTLLPSLGLSSLICLIIYAPVGISFFVPSTAVLGVFIVNLLTVMAATYIPMKKLALKTPSALLSAEDNSNLVSSPRRSANIARKNFPIFYELQSIFRFRKYFLRLTVIAVSFSTVFLCGLYIAHTNKQNAKRDVHEFEISTNEYFTMTNEEFEDTAYVFSDNETLKYFFWKDSAKASDLKLHALINEKNAKTSKYAYTIESDSYERKQLSNDGYSKTTDSFELAAYNKTLLDTIVNNEIYNIEGDVYSILDNDKTVIISEHIANYMHFDFEVGDSIIIAVPDEKAKNYNEDLLKAGKKAQVLKEMIPNSNFEYREYTVGAIIDYSGSDHFIVGMNQNAYTSLSLEANPKVTPSFLRNILVYVNKEATTEELDKLQLDLENAFAYRGYKVNETYNVMSASISELKGTQHIVIALSCLIMLISPLIWFFAQLRFYSRRTKEMFILSAIGATRKSFMKLYITAGILLAVSSAVLTLAMSYVADYLIYLVCTWLIPSMSSVGSVTVRFYMPTSALIICIISSVLCGFLSSLLPFVLKRFMRSKSEIYTVDGQ